MKRFIIICIACFLAVTVTYGQTTITVRPYVRGGLNLLPPTLEDLEFVGDMTGAEVLKRPHAVGAGAQVKLDLKGWEVGLDAGATTMYLNIVRYDQGVGVSNYVDEEYSVYINGFVQKPLSDIFFIQGGAGLHICPWFYEYYYESANYTDVYDEYSGVGISPALMIAAGTEVPISEKANLFLLGKMDLIARYGLMLPVTVNVGISIEL